MILSHNSILVDDDTTVELVSPVFADSAAFVPWELDPHHTRCSEAVDLWVSTGSYLCSRLSRYTASSTSPRIRSRV